MQFQTEFARFHAAIEATVRDATKSRNGFDSVQAADDALRVLEDHMNELERALVEIYRSIEAAQA